MNLRGLKNNTNTLAMCLFKCVEIVRREKLKNINSKITKINNQNIYLNMQLKCNLKLQFHIDKKQNNEKPS